MKYTKKQFIDDVTKEAIALKEHATKKEINRLDFDNLDPNSYKSCIYGQMTGNCKSKRASHLIFKCCRRFLKNDFKRREVSFSDVRKNLNGETIDKINTAAKLQSHRAEYLPHISSIEAYIMCASAKNKNLIDFLKGEREDLVP